MIDSTINRYLFTYPYLNTMD